MTDPMDLDLVIHGGTVVTAGWVARADIGVLAGKIAAVGPNLSGRETFEAQGMLVIPGGVDPHVHLEMPAGDTITSEDWGSGTLAAAQGGTTTVIDFVEPQAGQPLLDALAQRRAQAEGRAFVDFSLRMTLTAADPATLSQIPAVVAAGVTSFKLYTTYAGFALPDEGLLAAFEAVGAAGGLVMVHAENDAILNDSLGKLRSAGLLTPSHYPESRPAIAEVEAIQRVILLARYAGVPLYVAHISTDRGSLAVERAREHGQLVYGETCPHYLLLDEARCRAADPLNGLKFLCAPPLRKERDRRALWARLASGSLQCVSTDHCAFDLHGQKDRGMHSFDRSPAGLPGIEPRLALMHTFGVLEGRLTLQQWVARCCSGPAQVFGLYPGKGSLEVGADADLVVFDPDRKVHLDKSMLHERVDHTPFEGLDLCGWPAATFLSGRLIAGGAGRRSAPQIPSGRFIAVSGKPGICYKEQIADPIGEQIR